MSCSMLYRNRFFLYAAQSPCRGWQFHTGRWHVWAMNPLASTGRIRNLYTASEIVAWFASFLCMYMFEFIRCFRRLAALQQ
mmetsp:Transcript_46486/g.148478  ORF Transcript_46486/g.148478 Transcript_46486/m.148478 type:complete len:81 (-) Transcript_46486:62-304(-)